MRTALVLLAFAMAGAPAVCAAPASTRIAGSEPKPEPKLNSVYPATGRRGTSFDVVIRGSHLTGTRSAWFPETGVQIEIKGVEPDPESSGKEGKQKEERQLLNARVSLAPDAEPGRHEFRIVTPLGVSNKLALNVSDEPVLDEPEAARPLRQFPVIVNGRIARPGDTRCYWVRAEAGETLTFEAKSFSAGLDPSLTVYERSGSWFDPNRLNAIAFNDEPLFFPGLSTDARLVHRFAKAGEYGVEVRSFSGEGGPDLVYALRIARGVGPAPNLHPDLAPEWQEREFTRALAKDRLPELQRRGGIPPEAKPVETFAAALEGSADVPSMTAPGVVEGRIAKPGETHVIKLKVAARQDLAFEVETPQATLPRFNPVVRLMEPGGREIATDVYTKLNNNGLYMMKMIESKIIVSLNAPGEYTMQIRDIATSGGGPDCQYRVLVRPQIPHVGAIAVNQEHINLEAGHTQSLTAVIDREEGFDGYVVLDVEGLPAGVTAVPALENPPETPPLPNGGKRERYFPRDQRAAVMLVAREDAPSSQTPVVVKLKVRVVSGGRVNDAIFVKEIPLMVTARGES
jgi:hypothetical protein